MKTLIAEDDFTSRLILQKFLTRYGECHVAVNGREAVEAFRSSVEDGQRYDLICMDIMMPEMDGREAVKHVRALEESRGIHSTSGVKIIMTTALNEVSEVARCYAELCDAYMVKPINLAELLKHLKSYDLVQKTSVPIADGAASSPGDQRLSANGVVIVQAGSNDLAIREPQGSPGAPALTSALPPDELETDTVEMPTRLCGLPPLNAIANQVLTLSAAPDVDLQKLGNVMECDPAFSVDVLFLANSPLFGFSSRIQMLRHAIAVLGLDRIKAIAMTVSMQRFIGNGGPLLRQCWQHSAACAIIAKEISPIFGITSDTAYTLGLLHDIGRLGLLKSYTSEYSTLLSKSFDNVEQVLCAERALLKVDHALAGAWLVKQWALPKAFLDTCKHHHDALDPGDAELLQVIKLSCKMASAISYSAVKYRTSLCYDDVVHSLRPHIPCEVFPSAAKLRALVEARLASFR